MTTETANGEAAAAAAEQTGGKAEPSSARLIFTLGFAGLISGLALVGTFEGTLPLIKANQAAALERAVFQVVPGAAKMTKLQQSGGGLKPYHGSDPTEVIAAYDKAGNLAGFAIVGEGPGFQDTIKLIFGYDAKQQRITGMVVLDSRETPGLGDKIIKDADFIANFKALAVKPEVVAVKKGVKSKPNEIDAITGATISSKAVVSIINATNKKWLDKLPAAGSAPQAAAPAAPAAGAPSSRGDR